MKQKNPIKEDMTIWQADNGFVLRIGTGSYCANFLARDKFELASIITNLKYQNEVSDETTK